MRMLSTGVDRHKWCNRDVVGGRDMLRLHIVTGVPNTLPQAFVSRVDEERIFLTLALNPARSTRLIKYARKQKLLK